MVFGKAKFGGNGRNWFKVKDGANGPFRILPPMGELAEDGRWSVFYAIHYGYKNSKEEMRTFQSPLLRNRKTKMVEVPDAALDRINQLKAMLADAKEKGNAEQVAKLLDLVGGKKSRFNLDSNHYVNVVDLQGNIGILKIRHRAKLALDAEIKKLRDSGVEPLDPETGRFFVFFRSGMGMDTIYQVSVYQEKLTIPNVGEVKKDVVHQITQDLARRCCVVKTKGTDAAGNPIYARYPDGTLMFEFKEAARLDRLFKKPTAEEVERIVKEGPTAVDQILDSVTTVASDSTVDVDESGFEDDETPVAAAPAASPLAVPANVAPVTLTAPTPVATPVAAVAVATPPVVNTTPKTTAEAVNEPTDEEFLKGLGL